MGIRSWIGKRMLKWATNTDLSQNPLTGIFNLGSSNPKYLSWSTSNAISEGLEKHATVYRCVTKIARAMASVNWVVEDLDGETVEDGDLVDLIDKPHEKFTWNNLIQYVSGYKSLAGDAFLLYLQAGSEQALMPLYPGHIRVVENKQGMIKGYKYGTGDNEKTYEADQVVHLQFINYRDNWEGLAPLKPVGRIVDTDNSAVDWNKETLDKGGRPSGALKANNPLKGTQKQDLEDEREKMMDPENPEAHLPIFGADLDFLQFSLSAKELDYIESRNMNKGDIADAFGIPSELFSWKDATYENKRMARVDLWQDTIIPRLEEVKEGLNLQLSPLIADNRQLNYKTAGTPAMIGARLQRVEEAQKYFEMGYDPQAINDKLQLGFDEEDVPDTGFIASTKLPVDSAKSGIQSKQPDSDGSQGKTPPGVLVRSKGKPEERETRIVDLQTDEQKYRHWRTVTNEERGFYGTVSQRVKARFDQEKEKVTEAVQKNIDLGLVLKRQQSEWRKLLTSSKAAVSQHFIEFFKDRIEQDSRNNYEIREIDEFPPGVKQQIEQQTGQSIDRILETTESEISGILHSGKAKGWSKAKIVSEIGKTYSKFENLRAPFIARTEVHSASQMGLHSGAKQSNFVKQKRWNTSKDSRVREEHIPLDGQKRPINKTYSNGLSYPGDLSGPIEQVANCRCTEDYITARMLN